MRFGFFDNTEVWAEDFARFAGGLLTNGVLADTTNALKVSAGAGMHVSVAPGYCWINGHYGIAENAETLTIASSDGSLGRIDRIVARLDLSVPEIRLDVITGEPAAVPVPPDLVRSGNYYDLGLANVAVPAGALEIITMYITDTRADSDVCGAVLYRNADRMALDTKANKSDIVNPTLLPYRDLGEVFADEIAEFDGDAYAWIKSRILANRIDDIYLGDTLPPFEVEWEGRTFEYTPRVFRMEKQFLDEPAYIDFFCDELWFMPMKYQRANFSASLEKYAGTNDIESKCAFLASYLYCCLNNSPTKYVGYSGDTETVSNRSMVAYTPVESADPQYNVIGMIPNRVKNVISDKTKHTMKRAYKGPTGIGQLPTLANTYPNNYYESTTYLAYVVQNVGKLWLPNEYELYGDYMMPSDNYLTPKANMKPGVTAYDKRLLRKKRYGYYTESIINWLIDDSQNSSSTSTSSFRNNTIYGTYSNEDLDSYANSAQIASILSNENVLIPICFTISA